MLLLDPAGHRDWLNMGMGRCLRAPSPVPLQRVWVAKNSDKKGRAGSARQGEGWVLQDTAKAVCRFDAV